MESGRCKYASKFCVNERSRKANGAYHRFCDYHRIKANTAQRRWYARSRHTSVRLPRTLSKEIEAVYSAVRVSAPYPGSKAKIRGAEADYYTTFGTIDVAATQPAAFTSFEDVSCPISPRDLIHFSECAMDLEEIFVDDSWSPDVGIPFHF